MWPATQVTDALLETTVITRDPLGRPITVADPLPHTTQTVLDARDQAVGSIDGVGRTATPTTPWAATPSTPQADLTIPTRFLRGGKTLS
jgi:hypothetical protein